MSQAPTTGRALFAEALGTFVLVLFGVGGGLMSNGDYVVTALSFGLALLVMAYAVGRLSGAHFNPAVSLAAALDGRLSWARTGLYVLVQVAGGLLAGAMLWVLMNGFPDFTSGDYLGQNSFGAEGSGYEWWAAFLLEGLMTAVLVGVVLAVTDARAEHPALAPLAMGLALAVIHFASMRATGTSVNPARSIAVGPYAGADALRQLWLFILAPLLGAAVVGAGYSLVLGRGAEPVARSGVRRGRTAGGVDEPARSPVPGYTPEVASPPRWSPPPAAPEPIRPPAGLRPLHPSERTYPDDPDDWLRQAFPPHPTEPYWSQQIPREWGLAGDDDEDGRTQIRPTGG